MGAHIAAWFFGNTAAVPHEVQKYIHEFGVETMSHGFWTTLAKGIVAGWLLAMVVWLTAAVGEAGRFIAVALPTYIVGIGSFSHVIAGSIEALFLVMTGSLAWFAWAWEFLVPAFIGNSLGGVLLVTALNHAQVVADEEE